MSINQFEAWLSQRFGITRIGSYRNSDEWIRQNGAGFTKCLKLPISVAASSAVEGDVFTWQNPEQGAIILVNFQLDITTPSTGASTLDFGVAATVVTADNLINGIDSGTAAVKSQIAAADTNFREVPEGEYITGSEKTGDASAAMVGNVYITYAQIAN